MATMRVGKMDEDQDKLDGHGPRPQAGPRRTALFLDRDGVVNADRGFVARREDFIWQSGIFELVRHALACGLVPVIVTNQSGIGRGLYTCEDFATLNAWMLDVFAAQSAPIARVYHCPYHPDAVLPQFRQAHPWRKPSPGMLLAAERDFDLDLARSIMIGDRWSDVGAAVAAGIGGIVLVGPRAQEANPMAPLGLVRLDNMTQAVRWLVGHLAGARPAAD